MAIAVVANVGTGGSANSVTSSSINTTGSNLVVLVVSFYGSVALAGSDITDSNGNTWTALTQYTGGLNNVRIFYCFNPTVGSGHTFTATKTGSYPSICVLAVSGAKTSPYDLENGATSAGGSSSLATGSITPSENDEIVISGLYHTKTSGSPTIDSGMTIANSVVFSSGNYVGCGLAYKIQTTAAAINPTWSVSAQLIHAATIASFKAASATPIPVFMNHLRSQGIS